MERQNGMILRSAAIEDLDEVMDFYGEVIDSLAGSEIRLGWARGVYPSRELAETSIRNNELYVAVIGRSIAGALILNHEANERYKDVNWKAAARPEQAAVIHAFATSPRFRGNGVGKETLRQLFEICKEKGEKAIRLDVLSRNIPAAGLYRSVGFYFVETINMYYEPIGEQEFELYEYEL